MTRRAWLLFVALSLIWGVPYLLIRVAVQSVDPLIVAAGRTAIGALVLLPLAWRRGVLGPAFRRWRPLLLFTLVEISIPWVLLGHAETRLTSSTAGLMIAAVPLTAALLLALLGDERIDGRRLAGLALGFGGVAALVGLDLEASDLGAVSALAVAVLGYAIGPIVIARRLSDVPPLGVVTASLLLATALYAPFAPRAWPSVVPGTAAAAIVTLALLCTALAFLLFFALVAEAGPARATVITYVNPAIAVLLGVLVLDEPLTLGMAIGFPLVVVGSVLGTARTRDDSAAPARSPEAAA
jgi:drug/metabolite transporter (DMT)-like permease